jgi:uncharacterized protein YigE (DUF2233 family)
MLSPLIRLCVVALLCLAVPGTAQAETCRNTSFEGAAYIACSFDPAKQDLRLFWRGADDKPYLTFGALARDLKSKGKSYRQRRSWHPRDGTFSRREAEGEFRDAVRPDAHH